MASVIIGAFTSLGQALGIGGAAAAGAVEAGTGAVAAGAAGSGLSIASILQGGATVLGVVSSFAAGAADAQAQELAAQDAEAEKATETLQGIDRRRSIKAALADSIGASDAAYAASGVDLSFGSARQARQSAFREADLGLSTESGTEISRVSRLEERAANYRSAAKRSRMAGILTGVTGGLKGLSSIYNRGG